MLAKEKLAPFNIDNDDNSVHLYARLDIDQEAMCTQFLSIKHHRKTAVLFKETLDTHPTRFDETFFLKLIEEHLSYAKMLASFGVNRIVIAADNDGALQKILSPRTSNLSIRERIRPLLSLYEHVKTVVKEVDVLLTVEELAPFGLDATDGILIAHELRKLGLTHIIATSGTTDFMPLYERRITKKKSSQDNFDSQEPSLASALWLKKNTDLRVSCLAFINDRHRACEIAQEIGLHALIEKSAQFADV